MVFVLLLMMVSMDVFTCLCFYSSMTIHRKSSSICGLAGLRQDAELKVKCSQNCGAIVVLTGRGHSAGPLVRPGFTQRNLTLTFTQPCERREPGAAEGVGKRCVAVV